tara:strand:+ start:1228 stop:2013 length:786 start_codon:yes stop_codon:yes gene_type:complete
MHSGSGGAKKRFGQHFLHDPMVIQRILQALSVQPEDRVVEIGPGRGALTAPLLQKLPSLTVVEIDRDVIEPLRRQCGDAKGLDIRMGDALKFRFDALANEAPGQIRLIGNLPYNISTPLLFHLLDQSACIRDMLFMLQKEVVDRMVALPGEADYGRLSVTLAARTEVTHLFNVGAGAFNPPPKVESAIVRLVPRAPKFEIRNLARFNQVVTAAFSQRRKQLGNSLRQLVSPAQFAQADIDPSLRAERLSAEAFARISNLLD